MKLKLLAEQVNIHNLLGKVLNDDLIRLNTLYKKNGHTLRIVGGAVRDILSNKEPKDIDLASDATPTESMELLKANDIRVIETGLDHGTIVAHMNGEDYEITTLRIDKETDGRHAEVEYVRDWELDAARRDLTFNAMSMDFDGNLYDYHGGQEDLAAGDAKFVGDTAERVQEDYLRILRYFRFQARMDSPEFKSSVLKVIKDNVSGLNADRKPKPVSGERLWMEMAKIFAGKNLAVTLKHMKSTGVMDKIGLGDASNPMKVKANTDDPTLVLASMLSSVEALDALRGRWKFGNPEYNVMRFVLKNRDTQLSFLEAKRMHIMNGISKELISKLLEYQGNTKVLNQFKGWNVPTFPVNGEDLKAQGMSPGPELGQTLNRLKKQWVDSGYELDKESLLNTV
jgi:tRNA nucleotidyltransferase (CCA-adding enzyme)